MNNDTPALFAENENELIEISRLFFKQTKGKTLFAFYGKMGAGKTTFIKALCRESGYKENVTSPTFSLVNEYELGNNKKIFHFDFYRITKIEEVFDMGYEEYFYSGNICFIEWPEQIEQLLPPDTVRVSIEELSGGVRKISVQNNS